MKLSSVVTALLLDGEPRYVADLLPYLRKKIDPKQAVRRFLNQRERSRNNAAPVLASRKEASLEEQVLVGGYRVITQTLSRMRNRGEIEIVEGPDGKWKSHAIRLAPDAITAIKNRTNWQAGATWTELRVAWEAGSISMKVEVTP